MNRLLKSIFLLTLLVLLFVTATFSVSAQGQGNSQENMHGKKVSCEARQDAVETRMRHLLQLARIIESRFDRHAQRVEKYYTTKLQPKGIIVANYNDLLTDMAAKKVAVESALNRAQSDANVFSCASSHPKDQMKQFRLDMQAVKEALKDYKTSVRNLIVAVRTATSQAHNSGTPVPTK